MIKPKKSLGQHFLIDKNIINKIIEKANLNSNDIVVEIGAGKGALTFPLADKVLHVFAIEKDKELFFILKNLIEERKITNITLINEDILKWDFSEITEYLKGRKAIVMGNIPYNISSPLIEKLIKNKLLIQRAIIMFQMEFGKRLIASAGTKEYSALTVMLRYHANVKKLFHVSRNVFFPKPEIDSIVIEIIFDKKYPEIDEKILSIIVHQAFAHRRKKISNSLSQLFEQKGIGKDTLKQILENCGIDTDKRAESLLVEDFLCIASSLSFCSCG